MSGNGGTRGRIAVKPVALWGPSKGSGTARLIPAQIYQEATKRQVLVGQAWNAQVSSV